MHAHLLDKSQVPNKIYDIQIHDIVISLLDRKTSLKYHMLTVKVQEKWEALFLKDS